MGEYMGNIDILRTPKIDIKKHIEFDTNDRVLKEMINTFVSVLEEKISKDNLRLLYNNMSTLKIENKSILLEQVLGIFKDNTITGQYYLEDNVISILPLKDKNILGKYVGVEIEEYIVNLYHELLHMSSTVLDREKNMVFSGFSQIGKVGIGIALDDAYTEILLYRYFNLDKEYMSYKYEVIITTLIEDIIGKDKMTNLYFKADLYGLVKKLETYNTKEKIIEFIENLDSIYVLFDHSKRYRNDIIYYHNKIAQFLVDTYLNKLKEKGLLKSEYNDKLDKYLNSIHLAFEELDISEVKVRKRYCFQLLYYFHYDKGNNT